MLQVVRLAHVEYMYMLFKHRVKAADKLRTLTKLNVNVKLPRKTYTRLTKRKYGIISIDTQGLPNLDRVEE